MKAFIRLDRLTMNYGWASMDCGNMRILSEMAFIHSMGRQEPVLLQEAIC